MVHSNDASYNSYNLKSKHKMKPATALTIYIRRLRFASPRKSYLQDNYNQNQGNDSYHEFNDTSFILNHTLASLNPPSLSYYGTPLRDLFRRSQSDYNYVHL